MTLPYSIGAGREFFFFFLYTRNVGSVPHASAHHTWVATKRDERQGDKNESVREREDWPGIYIHFSLFHPHALSIYSSLPLSLSFSLDLSLTLLKSISLSLSLSLSVSQSLSLSFLYISPRARAFFLFHFLAFPSPFLFVFHRALSLFLFLPLFFISSHLSLSLSAPFFLRVHVCAFFSFCLRALSLPLSLACSRPPFSWESLRSLSLSLSAFAHLSDSFYPFSLSLSLWTWARALFFYVYRSQARYLSSVSSLFRPSLFSRGFRREIPFSRSCSLACILYIWFFISVCSLSLSPSLSLFVLPVCSCSAWRANKNSLSLTHVLYLRHAGKNGRISGGVQTLLVGFVSAATKPFSVIDNIDKRVFRIIHRCIPAVGIIR